MSSEKYDKVKIHYDPSMMNENEKTDHGHRKKPSDTSLQYSKQNTMQKKATKSLKNNLKNNSWIRFKQWLKQLSYEKMTVMIVPHNEAKMRHFHISMTTLIFLSVLFLTTIFTSVISFALHQNVNNKAQNLHKDALNIRRQLFIYTDRTRKMETHLRRLEQNTGEIVAAISYYENPERLFKNSKHDILHLDQLQPINSEDLALLQNIQKTFYNIGLQLIAAKEFITERRQVIHSTPSIWPAHGKITSLFGYRRDPFTYRLRFHAAIDIAGHRGTSIYATAPGIVKFIGYNPGYGKYLEISHHYGFSTLYAHNNSILVRQGQRVYKGQLIARMGNTGRSTGDHIHYEIHTGGYAINPASYLYRQ